MKDLFVVDASVVLKWVLPKGHEPWQEPAWALFGALRQRSIDVAVPDLWWYEVGNILSRKYPERAADHLSALAVVLGEGLSMSEVSLRTTCLSLVQRYRVTFYDAAYHALAIVQEGVFITADEKYLQAAAGEAHVMHLRDWDFKV